MPDDDDDRDVWRLVVNGEKWKEDDDDDAPKWDSALLRETMEHRELEEETRKSASEGEDIWYFL